jgi:hypothetical protein
VAACSETQQLHSHPTGTTQLTPAPELLDGFNCCYRCFACENPAALLKQLIQ